VALVLAICSLSILLAGTSPAEEKPLWPTPPIISLLDRPPGELKTENFYYKVCSLYVSPEK